ncbi:MAG: acyltransferase [Gemmataceae bacterium]|nr:acyltransferase [Gemmataceae bacterium]
MRANLDNLQALRGVACLAVVLYHLGQWESGYGLKHPLFGVFRWFGYAGVDLFFVISGFIIAHSNKNRLGQSRALPTYLFRRFWRLYPLYWIAFALGTALMAYPCGMDVRALEWRGNAITWFGLWPGVHTIMPHAWTLAFELLFYLAFAALFLLPIRAGVGLLALWGVAVLAVSISGYQSPNRFVHTATLPYVLEFLAGAALAWAYHRNRTDHYRPALALAFAWAVVAGLLVNKADSHWLVITPGPRILVFGLPAMLVVYALVAAEAHGRWRMPGWTKALGNASYSIYLMHMPVGAAMLTLTGGWSHRKWNHVGWSGLLLFACVGSGLLLYRLAEKPLMDLVKPKSAPSRRPSLWPRLFRSFATR